MTFEDNNDSIKLDVLRNLCRVYVSVNEPRGPSVLVEGDDMASYITDYCNSVIERAIKKLIRYEKTEKEIEMPRFYFEFNGINVFFNPLTEDAAVLEKRYQELSQKRHEEYLRSDEYKRRQEENAKEVDRYQKLLDEKGSQSTIDSMIENLKVRTSMPYTDFHVLCLYWFTDLANLCDRSGVVFHNKQYLIDSMKTIGLVANMNTGDNYVKGDANNEFDYMLGQILDGFTESHAPPPVLNTYASKWIKTHVGAEVDTFERTMNQIKGN